MENVKNEQYVICPRCKQEVYKEAIICPFCKFGIMAWLEGEIDENGDPIKKLWQRVEKVCEICYILLVAITIASTTAQN